MVTSRKTRRAFLGFSLGAVSVVLAAACGQAASPAATTAPAAPAAAPPANTPAPAAPAANAAPTNTPAPTAAAAPATTNKPTLRLSHWWGDQYKTWIPMIKAKTGISIDEEVIGWGDYYQKVLAEMVGGTAADIITIDTFWYGDFFKSGALLPLDDMIKTSASSGKLDPNKFYFPQNKECGYKGKQYGITIFLAQDIMSFVNKELADAAGYDSSKLPVWGSASYDAWKWKDWVTFLQAGTKVGSDGKVQQYGLDGLGWGDWGKTALYGNGGSYFGDKDLTYEETTINIDDIWTDTMQQMADLVLKYKVAPSPDVVIEGGAFKAKKSMTVSTLSTPSIAPPSLFPQYYMAQPPLKNKIKEVGGNEASINKLTKFPDDCFEWIRVYITDDQVRASALHQNAVPSYDPIPIVQAAPDGPEKTISLINISRAKGFSTIPSDAEGVSQVWRGSGRKGLFVEKQITNAWQAVLTGKTPVSEALKTAKTAIDAELAKP